ncbi:MAG: rhodanese-like domain-containing protein [Chloroflexota bacterium]
MTEDTFSTWLSGRDFEYWSTGQHKIEPPVFFEKCAKGEAVLLDVRATEELEFLRFPFTLEIPVNELPARLNEIPRDKIVATLCTAGDRSNVAFAYLQAQGFDNIRIISGGYASIIPEVWPGKVRKTLQAKNG